VTVELALESVRSDWYAANTLLPRLFFKAICRQQPLTLIGFPAQWIPVCIHYRVGYRSPKPPAAYIPIFSDLSAEDVARLSLSAAAKQGSRSLLEAVVALDPTIADFVYILDHKLAAAGHGEIDQRGTNLLNTWHSFSRPEIVSLQNRMCKHLIKANGAIVMPCSRRRPYGVSRTHGRLLRQLEEAGHDPARYPRVVVTALGVVPEAYWNHPTVMTYDAGAVDLWRVFQLLQVFLLTNHVQVVVDCLSFRPYSEMLGTLQKLGIVRDVIRPLKLRWRGFHVRIA
jgi:hypothetical protein